MPEGFGLGAGGHPPGRAQGLDHITPRDLGFFQQNIADLVEFLTGVSPPLNDRGSGTVHGAGDVLNVARANPVGVFKKLFFDTSPLNSGGDLGPTQYGIYEEITAADGTKTFKLVRTVNAQMLAMWLSDP